MSSPPTSPPVCSPVDRVKRTLFQSGTGPRRRLWLAPLVIIAVLVAIAWWIRAAVEHELKHSVEEQLTTVRDANVQSLQIWLKSQERNAALAAESKRVSGWAVNLIDMIRESKPDEIYKSGAHMQLGLSLEPWLDDEQFEGFVLLDRDWTIVGSTNPELIGRVAPTEYGAFLEVAFGGTAIVSRPFPALMVLQDNEGNLRAGLPTMYVAAPVRSEGEIVGVLALRIRPEREFTRILQVSTLGQTGESYAFDEQGLMLTESRFDRELKTAGLIPDNKTSRSILSLTLKDPGVDLYRGERPRIERDQRPFTFAVRSAIENQTAGVNVEGYRDYLGISSVGAWTWIDKHGFGVITEVNHDEAYRAATIVRRMFLGIIGLLALSSATILVVTWFLTSWQKTARQAVLVARQLGQYTLEEKVGVGGMGTVYRAHHAMLRRPTAVKLLNIDRTNETTLKRFEREVQLTSQLNHPNTVAIYDFGRTPEGIFYYAMEFLDGLNLHDLVEQHGPQPPGRVIHIVRQICGSLAEAHDLGLIHRDIKPANVLLNRRGGMSDVVKVVDFGLVKDTGRDQLNLTHANAITGTPMYMAPESIDRSREVDGRADIYAVGGVAYYLLTGTGLFLSDSLFDLLRLQSTTMPDTPSQRLGTPMPADLEGVIMACLAKNPENRPQSARELEHKLARCGSAREWSGEDAEQWWREYHSNPQSSKAKEVDTSAGQAATLIA